MHDCLKVCCDCKHISGTTWDFKNNLIKINLFMYLWMFLCLYIIMLLWEWSCIYIVNHVCWCLQTQRRESDSLDLEIWATLGGKIWGRSLNLVLWKNSRNSLLLSQLSSPLGHLLSLQTIKHIFRTPQNFFLNFKKYCAWISEGRWKTLNLT